MKKITVVTILYIAMPLYSTEPDKLEREKLYCQTAIMRHTRDLLDFQKYYMWREEQDQARATLEKSWQRCEKVMSRNEIYSHNIRWARHLGYFEIANNLHTAQESEEADKAVILALEQLEKTQSKL